MIHQLRSGDVVGSEIPQHRLLSKKEWAWIRKGYNYSYWTTLGPRRDHYGNLCFMHDHLIHIDKDERAV